MSISATVSRSLYFLIFILGTPLSACPWCDANPAMKPTVNVGDSDPGGKFFGKEPDPARVRRYYIAAENEIWDYLPEGKDPVMGNPIPPHIAESPKAPKARYFQYTDETFTTRVLPNERLGVLGPVMRGVTGDFIVVTLLNKISTPVSLHPHGVRYDKDSEGSGYLSAKGRGSSIAPGAKFTYVWQLDEASAPRPDEPSSKPWLYHSHVQGDDEINAGLTGFIVVTDSARARPDGTPNNVDREMALMFQNFNESGVSEAQEYANVKVVDGKSPDGGPPPPVTPWPEAQETKELSMRHAINGRIFGNLKGLQMVDGERVRWYLFALGIDPDVHTAHWHGARVRDHAGHMTDVIELMPGSMKSADMLADNPGDWMIHCHVGDHMMEGMYGVFSVMKKGDPAPVGDPFFGISALKSVEWLAAEGDLDSANFNLKIKGVVTAYAQLALWNTSLGITVGRMKAKTQLAANGAGANGGVKFKVLNGDPSGIVQGDRLEVEIILSGPEWQAVVRSAMKSDVLGLVLTVDSAEHSSQLPLMTEKGKLSLKR